MNNTNKITAAQIETIRKILRHGGRVYVTNGRLREDYHVSRGAVSTLARKGYVTGYVDSVGRTHMNLTVTAAGCVAYNEAAQPE